jgi:mRNA-degrading endonuclease toxin of MazEF toxin-antitoxin module
MSAAFRPLQGVHRKRLAGSNQYSFLALPLSTATRANRWRIAIGKVAGKDAVAVLSQLRNLDSLRLYQKIGHVDPELLMTIKKTASRMNFG